jgi:DNA polymerase III delta prime subunit
MSDKIDRLYEEMLRGYPGGLSNTSNKKFDPIKEVIAGWLSLTPNDVYATGAGTRPGNLEVRLSQGLQATKHTPVGLAFLKADTLKQIATLTDSAAVTIRKFIGRRKASYDAVAILIEYDGKPRMTRLLKLPDCTFDTTLKSHYPDLSIEVLDAAETPPDLGARTNRGQAGVATVAEELPAYRARSSQNVIFYGPPGTGKSKRAEELAKGKGATIFRTLFHPEFTYADFVGSYRPVVGYDEKIKIKDADDNEINKPINYFRFVPGVLSEALRSAFLDPDTPVVLLIDEINRGDCAAIFGDFFQLLDRSASGASKYGINADSELLRYLASDGLDIDIAGDGKLYLPENLGLFATMNTSDQSLYAMDAAFKRRWTWQPCHIDFSEFLEFYGGRVLLEGDTTEEQFDWVRLLEAINRRISLRRMEEKQIGPWFVLPDPTAVVHIDEFSNKCLFYLWHDVFKDDHAASESPFRMDETLTTFAHLQQTLSKKGLRAILKDEVMREVASKPLTDVESKGAGPGASGEVG